MPHARTRLARRHLLAILLGAAALLAGVLAPVGLAHPGHGDRFRDDDDNVHEGFIEAIADAGITSGCRGSTSSYCPGDPVTRGQMATFLARALDLDTSSAPDRFTDDDGTAFEASINAVAEAGITSGCGGTAFCPGSSVTRGQMAAFLVRAFDLPPGDGSTDFADDDASIFEADIEALAAAGITGGCGGRDFCPGNPVRRDQMATFLGRALGLTSADIDHSPGSTPARDGRLADVSSWVYQLQDVNLDALASSPFDLAVIDAEDDAGEPWSAVEVSRLRAGDRIVLAYLSIGEAEDYRDYWDPGWDADGDGAPDAGAPGWLADENPDWEGNYLVRFWDPAWQELIGARLDAIVTAGFDGAYLDIVDAYERWQDDGRPGAAADMAAFVTTLADRARAEDAGFLMFPQNAAGILGELSEQDAAAYLDVVDGIGAEDTFFFGDAEHDNPYAPQTDTIAFLDRFVAAGDLVLAVDYLTDPAAIDRFVDEAREHGYVPYAGTRELDRIVPQP